MRRAAAGTRRLTTPIRSGVQAGRTAQIVASRGILPLKRFVLRRFFADLHHAGNHPAGRWKGIPPTGLKAKLSDSGAAVPGGRIARLRTVGRRACDLESGKTRAGHHASRAGLTFIIARISNAAPQRALTDARPDGSSASTQFPDHGASLPRPSGKPQRRRAPVPQKICPLPAHGRATSRMKKIKQPQHQRTKSRERAAGRSPSGCSGGRVAPAPDACLRGGAGREDLSFRSSAIRAGRRRVWRRGSPDGSDRAPSAP